MNPKSKKAPKQSSGAFKHLAKQLFSIPKHEFDKVVTQKPETTKDLEDKDSDVSSESG